VYYTFNGDIKQYSLSFNMALKSKWTRSCDRLQYCDILSEWNGILKLKIDSILKKWAQLAAD